MIFAAEVPSKGLLVRYSKGLAQPVLRFYYQCSTDSIDEVE